MFPVVGKMCSEMCWLHPRDVVWKSPLVGESRLAVTMSTDLDVHRLVAYVHGEHLTDSQCLGQKGQLGFVRVMAWLWRLVIMVGGVGR